MYKVNFTLDDEVREELVRLIPARKRSKVANDAIRKELLRMKRAHAMERLGRLRKKTGTFSSKEIIGALRQDRARRG